MNDIQIRNTLEKLKRFENTLKPYLFDPVDEIKQIDFLETQETFYHIPDSGYRKMNPGERWGQEKAVGYFRTQYRIPERLNGKTLFLKPHTLGYETLFLLNQMPHGIFANRLGNHYCNLLCSNARAAETYDICLEVYCGHYIRGCQPFEYAPMRDFSSTYDGLEICEKNELINQFYFALRIINEMVEALEPTSYRRADLINTLEKVHNIIYYDPDHVSREAFDLALSNALPLLLEQLTKKNGPTAPVVSLVGHSHMDTAWLWSRTETIKKCARTFANQLALMEQYPEHHFIQSSAYHGEMILKHYPQLFKKIQQKVQEHRYEPNGAVYVECDCNITGGEALIRQFLWGQRFTQKHFNFTSDTFWLPDTFGYSASIPQIMKGCRVNYFATTKMAWNDSTDFPYDSFLWEGIDGSRVFCHFPKTHENPYPKALARLLFEDTKKGNTIKDKRYSQMKLLAYGYGDGGGGPQFEQLECGRLLADVEGMPKAQFTNVSDFMRKLEASMPEKPVYSGELYLELHRGTLTNQHEIKRNNRKAEITLHDLEFLTVSTSVKQDSIAENTEIAPLMKLLLINQFHDILPGTGIPIVQEDCRRDMRYVLAQASDHIKKMTDKQRKDDTVSVTNTLSFTRNDVLYLDIKEGMIVDEAVDQQWIVDVEGHRYLAVSGISLQPYETKELHLIPGHPSGHSAFICDDLRVQTPHARICFNEQGAIDSFFDLHMRRELRGEGYPLNTFLMAEDVSLAWDNWDIDADLMQKMHPTAEMISRRIVSDGPLELRIESEYRLSEKSTLTQQMIFQAASPEIRFQTIINWQEDHRFLKTAFDTSIFAQVSRSEIQFGYLERPTHNNSDQEAAKFEVCCHKYVDLSESRCGVALLNDCKYGVYAKGRSLRLSLHKGGCNPDFTGDKGSHKVVYSFLPHNEHFSARSVIQPAYLLNYPILQGNTSASEFSPVCTIDQENVICESVKPCEDSQKAYILRLYEAEGTGTHVILHIQHPVKKIEETNMLEEPQRELGDDCNAALTFHPFEIKTIKVYY